jgi:UDP-N-acetyl-2-amino-2-deoxyglucuronate dehydrogenase
VIGCGHIGKKHAAMIQTHPEAELVALCDAVSIEQLTGLEAFESIPFFNSIDNLLASNLEIDVINIASPNGYHEEHALKVLAANKHVVIEKPMALTTIGCQKIIDKATEIGKQVFCIMQNRYSPPSVWLKELLDTGTLGKIFMVQINCFWNRDNRYYKPHPQTGQPSGWHGTKKLDGGPLFTQFSHFIDLLYWCFGNITNIQTKFRNFTHTKSTEFEDSGLVIFDFTEGGIGSFNYSTAVWNKNLESSITITAENGTVKIGGQYADKITYCHIKNYEMTESATFSTLNSDENYKGVAMNHYYIIENVVNVLKNRASIAIDAKEGMKVIDIIERVYQVVKS